MVSLGSSIKPNAGVRFGGASKFQEFPTLAASSSEEAKEIATDWAEKLELKLFPDSIDRKISKPLLQPNQLDMRVIASLRYNAIRPGKDISEELSITYRMAEYEIGRLLDSRIFFVVAVTNPHEQSGMMFFGMSLFVTQSKQAAALDELKKRYGYKQWLVRAPNDRTIIANLYGFTIGEPEDTFVRTLRMDGVTGGFLVLNEEHSTKKAWLD